MNRSRSCARSHPIATSSTEGNTLTSTLHEVLERRQKSAARNARRAAIALRDGDSDDLRAQLDVEDALDDLLRFTRMANELHEVADDLEPYGRRSPNSLLHDMVRAFNGNK